MKIVQAIELFYKLSGLLKEAFIPTREAIPQIKSVMPLIMKTQGREFAERYLFLFEQAFKEHDVLYNVVANTLDGKGVGFFSRTQPFDKVAEEAMNALNKLIAFVIKNIIQNDDMEEAQIQGRLNAVKKGYEESLEYYYKFYAKGMTPPSILNATASFTLKFHSTYHGLLEYLLRITFNKLTNRPLKMYQPFEY